MNILHFASEYPPQQVFGLGRYVAELAAAQVKDGHSVEVLTNSLSGQETESTSLGVRIRRVHFPPPPKAPATSAMLLHFNLQLLERCIEQRWGLKNSDVDVVAAHDWLTVPAAFHASRLLHRPLVTTIHDVVFNKVRSRKFNSEDEFVAGIENWAVRTSARTIVLSEQVKREVHSCYHCAQDRIAVIPSGVAIPPAESAEILPIEQWRKSIAPNGEVIILYAGRLDPEKGLSTLLNALPKVKTTTHWRVTIAGSGQLSDHYKDHVIRSALSEYVSFLGYLPFDELRIAYAGADLVVVPSDYEPFGLVALEAQRMGTPVIVSLTGGLKESFCVTGGGLAFEPGDSDQLAAQITSLVDNEDLRINLGQKAQRAVETHFCWENASRRITAVYNEAIKCPPPENLIPPPWSEPAKDASTSVSNVTLRSQVDPLSTTSPVSDVTLFCDNSETPELQQLIQGLSTAHALRALNGHLNIVRIDSGTESLKYASARWVRHFSLQQNLPEMKDVIRNSATLIAPSRLHSNLTKSGLVIPTLIPVVWYGAPVDGLGGCLAQDKMDIYVLVTKLLCDERLRRRLAPELYNPIPQIKWRSVESSRPNVFHILPQIVTGGAETTLLEIIKGTRNDVDHKVINLGPTDGPLASEYTQLGAPVINLSTSEPTKVAEILQSDRPAILHLHSMSYIPGWIRMHRQLADQCIIETEHVVNIGSGHFGPVQSVICVSNAAKDAHNPYLPLLRTAVPKYRVIYNGIEPLEYANTTRAEARKLLDLPTDVPVIGRVSALARNKLPREAIELIPKLLEAVPNSLFVVVGDGPERKRAEDWIRTSRFASRVRFIGERRDVPKILKAFDVFAYYTTKDSLGNVILEAVAAGVPVVTTDVEGTREALGKAPGTAVPLGDFAAFATAVKDWMDRAHRGIAPVPLDIKFTRAFMASNYSEVYRENSPNPPSPEFSSPSLNRLLIKFPTRSRPQRFFDTLERYIALQSGKHHCEILVTCDEDDPSMNNEIVRERLRRYPYVSVNYGRHASKVAACNADILRETQFDVLLLASDDMIPVTEGYDHVILQDMQRYFPSTDGILFYNDGYRGRCLNTLCVLGKKYYDRFSYIYNPLYESLWCDNEFTDVGNLLARQVYLDRVLIRHEHPANTGTPRDELYVRNDAPMDKDRNVYRARKQNNFGILPRKLLTFFIVPTSNETREAVSSLQAHVAKIGLGLNIAVVRANATDGLSQLLLPVDSEFVGIVDAFSANTETIDTAYHRCADGSYPGADFPLSESHENQFPLVFRRTELLQALETNPPLQATPVATLISSHSKKAGTAEQQSGASSLSATNASVEIQSKTALSALKKEKVLFLLLYRMGDVLCGGPTFKALRQKHESAHLGWCVLPKYKSLVPTCADEVIPHGDDNSLQNIKLPSWLPEWDHVYHVQPSFNWEEWATAKLPLIHFIARKAGITLSSPRIELELSQQHRARATELTADLDDFVVINAGPHNSGPQWDTRQRAEIIQSLLRQHIPVVTLAGQDGVDFPGARALFGLDFHTAAAVIDRARLYIGQDCGTSWLACAAHTTPKIVLIDRSEGRSGYDSYVNSLADENITELPLDESTRVLLEQIAESWELKMNGGTLNGAIPHYSASSH